MNSAMTEFQLSSLFRAQKEQVKSVLDQTPFQAEMSLNPSHRVLDCHNRISEQRQKSYRIRSLVLGYTTA